MTEFCLESIKTRLTESELRKIAEDALSELRRREYHKLKLLKDKCAVLEKELDKTHPNYFGFCAALDTMKEGYTAYQACRINELGYDYEEYRMIEETYYIRKTKEYKRWVSAEDLYEKREKEYYECWGCGIWNDLLHKVTRDASDNEKNYHFYGLERLVNHELFYKKQRKVRTVHSMDSLNYIFLPKELRTIIQEMADYALKEEDKWCENHCNANPHEEVNSEEFTYNDVDYVLFPEAVCKTQAFFEHMMINAFEDKLKEVGATDVKYKGPTTPILMPPLIDALKKDDSLPPNEESAPEMVSNLVSQYRNARRSGPPLPLNEDSSDASLDLLISRITEDKKIHPEKYACLENQETEQKKETEATTMSDLVDLYINANRNEPPLPLNEDSSDASLDLLTSRILDDKKKHPEKYVRLEDEISAYPHEIQALIQEMKAYAIAEEDKWYESLGSTYWVVKGASENFLYKGSFYVIYPKDVGCKTHAFFEHMMIHKFEEELKALGATNINCTGMID